MDMEIDMLSSYPNHNGLTLPSILDSLPMATSMSIYIQTCELISALPPPDKLFNITGHLVPILNSEAYFEQSLKFRSL